MFVGVGIALQGRGGGAAAKTYAEYQAAIAALPTAGNFPWGNNADVVSRSFTTVAAAATGTMVGSSWSAVFQSGECARLVQHGLKDTPTFDAQVAGGFRLYLTVTNAGANAAVALARNGFTSSAAASADSARLTRLIRWDDTLKKAFESNPSVGGAETEWVF